MTLDISSVGIAAVRFARALSSKARLDVSCTTSSTSKFLPFSGIVMHASVTIRASIVLMVSIRAAWAIVARPDAFKQATGFCMNSPLATTQSRAFLITPVTPCAYSGLAIRTASVRRSAARNAATSPSSVSSLSGLNEDRKMAQAVKQMNCCVMGACDLPGRVQEGSVN